MTTLKVLPHETLCPEGREIEATPGRSICDTLLDNGIEIEHACEKSCACTTCHVIVREGFDSLEPATEKKTTCSTRRGGWSSRRASRARRR
jgi:ferredoxin, 2Fe-2S